LGAEVSVDFLIGDVFDRLAEIEDGSVDLVITSPPFLALRSYLPSDHKDKDKEIGSEATPAAFLDTLLAVTAELRRVSAPHGSIAIELGDTYAGSGGGGGDYLGNGWREGQQQFAGSQASMRESNAAHWRQKNQDKESWPLAKSKTLIPELFRIALAYGFNPLTGAESPAGKWRVRNVVTWCRPNPPVGALGDKWRPATSDVVVACVSGKRYWDDLATRKPNARGDEPGLTGDKNWQSGIRGISNSPQNASGAPLLDYWEIPPTGFTGAHYAVYPPALVVPLVKAMCPEKVCRTCGEPSRRIVETEYEAHSPDTIDRQHSMPRGLAAKGSTVLGVDESFKYGRASRIDKTLGFTDCGHDNYRPGLVLDPFAGSGTTLAVAQGHGHDAIGIDLDERNAELATDRVGPMFLEVTA
jgi:hypothetical protein